MNTSGSDKFMELIAKNDRIDLDEIQQKNPELTQVIMQILFYELKVPEKYRDSSADIARNMKSSMIIDLLDEQVDREKKVIILRSIFELLAENFNQQLEQRVAEELKIEAIWNSGLILSEHSN